ncbi:MAG: hypothetical protein K6C13_08130 [Oscillospiraceae bacterium]|nr:hypothetical protein [Oscillospiraceae bacterium]
MAERYKEPSGITEGMNSGIDFSLDEEAPPDLTKDIDFSLDKDTEDTGKTDETDEINETNTPPDLTKDIDFSLDTPAEPLIPDNRKEDAEKSFFSHALAVFSPMRSAYAERDNALMNAEARGSLLTLPLFIAGAAAAYFFYYVLTYFEVVPKGASAILILLCICAGVLPACIVIPNAVKCESERRKAAAVDEKLREFYEKADISSLPYDFTSPLVIEHLAELIRSGEADSANGAIAAFGEECTKEFLAAERKTADFSPSDELSARSAALYVAGKGVSVMLGRK